MKSRFKVPKLFLILFVSFLAIAYGISYATSIPRGYEKFFSLSVSGKSNLLYDYYPSSTTQHHPPLQTQNRSNATSTSAENQLNANTTLVHNKQPPFNPLTAMIDVGDRMQWHVNVFNKTGKTQLVSLKIKLMNATQTAPDDMSHLPSPEPSIFEVRNLLMKDQTWVWPLSWSLSEVEKHSGYITIKGLEINQANLKGLNAMSQDGNFRILIELWYYDTDKQEFVYTWSSGVDERSVWNQVWFKVKS